MERSHAKYSSTVVEPPAGVGVSDSALNTNLRLYRLHQFLAGALFWGPTVFLYFVDQFGLATALRVQAVYYAAVVVFEVPSGWVSDRFGRARALRLVGLAWVIAHIIFASVGTVSAVVVAQILLALGYAMLSGTDVTFHLETLAALGRSDDYSEREASSRQLLLAGTALSALVGGALAMIDLRLPFVISAAAAAAQLAVASRFVEPERISHSSRFLGDMRTCIGYLRHGVLRWVALYMVAQVVAVHLASEFTAPYLAAAFGGSSSTRWAALAAGVIASVVAAVAAVGVKAVQPAFARFGLAVTLVCAAALPVIVVVAMAAVTTLWVVPLLAMRRVQGAAAATVLPALVAARVGEQHRATFLSLTSLLGRLTYVVVLLTMSSVGDDELARSLRIAAIVVVALWLVVALAARLGPPLPRVAAHSHHHDHDEIVHSHAHRHDDLHHDHAHAEPVQGVHEHEHYHPPMSHAHSHVNDAHHRHVHHTD